MAHPDFGRSVNPISTRGTDYAHLITTGTPGFSDLPTARCCGGGKAEVSYEEALGKASDCNAQLISTKQAA